MIFYHAVQDKRFFSAGKKYNSIIWNDFKQVVNAFKTRIEDWYIKPAELLRNTSWDNSFALMAINCLLIDALSQFHYGKTSSSRGVFKKFTRRRLPAFREKLSIEIRQRQDRKQKDKRKPNKKAPFKTYADVLYHCFRCGILHDAHITLCGGLAGLDAKMVDTDTDVCTTYRDGKQCPTVRMDPTVIFDEVRKLFDQYLSDLLNPDKKFDTRRKKFKRKFTDCIGVDIMDAA